jgi:hypothetical protein
LHRDHLKFACCVVIFAAIMPVVGAAQDTARKLVSVAAPNHDPLFIDMASVQRKGAGVAFKYVLDVLVEFEGKGIKSNEVEATIDCAQDLYGPAGRCLSRPRATGTATGVHSPWRRHRNRKNCRQLTLHISKRSYVVNLSN